MAEDLTKSLYHDVKKHWYNYNGLAALLGLTTLIVFVFVVQFNLPLSVSTIVWGLSISGATFFWTKSQKRFDKTKFGVGIALSVEANPSCQELYQDFVSALSTLFDNKTIRQELEFIEFPLAVADSIKTGENAITLAQRTHANVLLHGKVRRREHGGSEKNIVDLRCTVRHVPLNHDVSAVFAKELNIALPGRWFFRADQNFLEAEFAAQHVASVSKYIIGVTCAFAGDYVSAEDFLVQAHAELKALPASLEITDKIISRIEGHLIAVYRSVIEDKLNGWRATGDKAILAEVSDRIEKLLNISPNDFFGRNAAAISQIVLLDDAETAENELMASEEKNTPTWNYNKAFLRAYQGDLDSAYKYYRKAFEYSLKHGELSIIAQCEEFIHEVVANKPEAGQLYFCLGLINYKAKKDYIVAAEYFEKFLSSTSAEDYPVQHTAVLKWLKDIKLQAA